jgi:hypothetical protein
MDLTDIYRLFHPAASNFTLVAAYGVLYKIVCILGHEASFNQQNKIEITAYVLSDQVE